MLRYLVLALCAFAPLAAAQVQVTLTDGQVVEGELLKEDDQSITLQQRMAGKNGGMKATITYPRLRVSKIEPVPDAAARYTEMLGKTADTAPAHMGLADWCREHDLRDLAIERAKHVLALEPGNPKAIELLNALGLFLLDGAWLTEAEYCAKTGKVRYKDRLLSPAEVEAAKAKDEADEAAKTAQSAANQAGTKSERLTSDIAAADKQLKTLEEAKNKAGADASQAAATQERYTALERDLTNAQNKANAEKKDGGKITQGTQNEVSNAQARMDKERTANREAARTKETATAKLAALDKQIAVLKSKRQDLSEQKTAADKAAAEKKAAADKAASEAKAAADAKPVAAPVPAP